MKFWDSSALVPLLVEEPTSQALQEEFEPTLRSPCGGEPSSNVCPRSLPLVTLDDRLAQAAEREGFAPVRPDRTA